MSASRSSTTQVSPDTVSPGNGRLATAQSTNPPGTSSLPFDHRHGRPGTANRLDVELVHQPLGARQADAEASAGRPAVGQGELEVGDAWAVVAGDHADP